MIRHRAFAVSALGLPASLPKASIPADWSGAANRSPRRGSSRSSPSRTPAAPANRWLVEVDWWRRPVAREYWKLVVSDRVLCEVYHDLDQDAWFLERVYD